MRYVRVVGVGVTDPTATEGAVEQLGDSAHTSSGNDSAAVENVAPALKIFGRVHPLGWVIAGVLVVAVLWHTLFDTERMIGNLAWWQWAGLALVGILCLNPNPLNLLRKAIESLAEVTKQIVWVLAWLVFLVQLFNVITRYANPLFDTDILIGQMTSLAWQLFAAISLLGLNYGVKAQVNPRVDFWWAEWSDMKKAWLDFVMHVFLFLPFLYMSTVLLQRYASIALGQRRDSSWPSGWKVWQTWEKSPDADQLPVGGIKAVIFIGFVLFALQILAEVIKVGFVLMGRKDMAEIAERDEFQRIE